MNDGFALWVHPNVYADPIMISMESSLLKGHIDSHLNIFQSADVTKAVIGLSGYKLFQYKNGRTVTLAITNRISDDDLTKTFPMRSGFLLMFQRGHPRKPDMPVPRIFEPMKQLAKELSSGFPFALVDFYEANNRLHFGKITFYPNSGFELFNPACCGIGVSAIGLIYLPLTFSEQSR